MKVLYAVDYYQPQVGYSEYFIPHELQKMGHTVMILTSNFYYPFPNYEESAGKMLGQRRHRAGRYVQEDGVVVAKEELKAEVFTRAIIGNHEKYVQEFKPDLVIVNKTAGWNAIRLAQLKKKYGYFLLTYDAHLPSGFKAVGNPVVKEVFYFIFRMLFARLLNTQGDHHVAVQEGTVEIMRDYYGIDKITHIPLGTDIDRFRYDAKARTAIRKEFGIPKDAFVVIYTGKVVPTKGVHILFEAVSQLFSATKDLYVLIVGAGPDAYSSECLSFIQDKYHSRIKWAGFCENKQLYRYYSAADVGVWPLEESTSMNDAAACGLPFIANDTVGARYRLKNDNALLYKRGDAKDLARKIASLESNRTLAKEMGKRGNELVTREMSWSMITQSYLRLIYQDIDTAVQKVMTWLNVAQDTTRDGGVSAYYSLVSGWAPSFIETTGYIISTYLRAQQTFPEADYLPRAIKMGNFLIDMQLPEGGYRTYVPQKIKDSPPTVFNTAQDILGLVDLYEVTKHKKYLTSAIRAAAFLVSIQEKDGTWCTFTHGGDPKTYHSRVAYALLRVYEHTHEVSLKRSAKRQLDWVISQQQKNGYVKKAELPVAKYRGTITHTISYVAEGLYYSGKILKEEKYTAAARLVIDRIVAYVQEYRSLPSYFDTHWRPLENFGCPTGEAQLSILMIEMFRQTGREKYRECAGILVRHLLRIQQKGNNPNLTGGIPGCTPLLGDILRNRGYCRMSLINWAAKFAADAWMEYRKI